MSKGGVFRGIRAVFNRIVAKVRGWFGHYPDPLLRDPYAHQRTRKGTKKNRVGKKRLQAPDCIPGTITYFDALVRYYGYDRRRADQAIKDWRKNGAPLPNFDERGELLKVEKAA